MKRILVISWFYPPVNSSEGLVTFKLINNSQFQYDVFTQKSDNSWSYGNNMKFQNNDNVKTIFGKGNSIQEWMDSAYHYFKKNCEKYDIIMTRAMPQESHIIGMRIKKDYPEVKWIASFGDPIKANPYHYISCSLYSPYARNNKINKNMSLKRTLSLKRNILSFLWNIKHRNDIKFRKTLNKIEEDTLKLADRIILNNESQKAYMLNDNERLLEKTVVINHSYDKNMYPTKPEVKNEKIKFVFIGHLDEIRTPRPLLHAIALLNDSVKKLSEKVTFEFYGELAGSDKLFILDNDLLDIVKIKKPISYSKSLEVMQSADWLIHIDGNVRSVVDENIFFAAKIADYFGSQTNIFAITMQNGAVVDILSKANAMVLSYSVEEIKNYLYLIIEQEYKRELDLEYIQNFESSHVAQKFDEMLADLDR